MKELIERIWDEAYSAWRFRWIALAVAALIAVTGWVVVFALPDQYEATASVFVDTRTALRPALQGLTVEQDVNVQLNYVRQSLLSGERLERIARASGAMPETETDPRKIAAELNSFVKRLSVEVRNASPSGRENEREAGAIYLFRFKDSDRDLALSVTRTVVNTFVEETLGGKREGAEQTQRFLEAQLDELDRRLHEEENRLAEFKREHVGLMPTEQGGTVAQLQLALDTAATLENDLKVAQARRAELARQLRGDAVVGATAMPVGSGPATDSQSQVNAAQAELDALLLRFTEKHPAVIGARTRLEEAQRRRQQEIEALRSGDVLAAASSGVSSNPIYQSLQQQLAQADVEIASLRGRISQHHAKAAELRKQLDIAPKVEAELAELTRNLEVLKAQRNGVLENLEKVRLGERADSAGSVRFEIIQPATALYEPVSPRRPLLLAAAPGFGLAVGAALAFLLHMVRPVIASARSLGEITDLPVIGVVSPAFPAAAAARARGELLRIVGALVLLVAVFLVVMVLNGFGMRFPTGAS